MSELITEALTLVKSWTNELNAPVPELRMIEKLLGLEKTTIHQCQIIAKKMAMENKAVIFELVGPTGRLEAKWLDPHLGFFTINGESGFQSISMFDFSFNLIFFRLISTI